MPLWGGSVADFALARFAYLEKRLVLNTTQVFSSLQADKMADPRKLSFLLISDVHFGPSAFSEYFALVGFPPKHQISGAVPMKAHLIETLRNKTISSVLAGGDLTSTGYPSEFKQCSETVIQIGKSLGVESQNIFFTFGNHDVDWRVSSLSTQPEESKDPLYRDLAGSSGNIFMRNPTASEIGPLSGCAIYKRQDFVLFVANTGYYCSHDQEYSHGVLGKNQLNWLRESFLTKKKGNSCWRILLLHHHPRKYPYPTHVEDISSVQEDAELLDIIGQSEVDIVCHGHRHHPYLCTTMWNGWAAPVTFLCAGSLAVNEKERRLGEIPNLCHVVNLESRLDNGAAAGSVETYTYGTSNGWALVSHSNEVPLDGIQRFGSIATETEMRTYVHELIASVTECNSGDCIDLVPYQSLPFPLQCMPVRLLNDMVKKVAMNCFSRKVIGSYPGEYVMLRK